jgi:hypothetical protein
MHFWFSVYITGVEIVDGEFLLVHQSPILPFGCGGKPRLGPVNLRQEQITS